MNALQAELRRLYLLAPAAADDQPPSLVDAQGRVRALVFALSGPPDWLLLSRVWQGVQSTLGLPAPAIAVSGTDALQLWFSLAEPVPSARAQAWLERLRERFLPEVDTRRVRLWPAAEGSAHAALVPAPQAEPERWSAFVSPDLAPVFADSPWLDIPPGDEGQAGLLRGLTCMASPDFDEAMLQLDDVGTAAAAGMPAAGAVASASLSASASASASASSSAEASDTVAPTAQACASQARSFLLRVMHDESVALESRLHAARLLLGDRP